MSNENPGEGGSYLLDPKTGKRKLIKQTLPFQTKTEVTTDGTTDKETVDSDGNRR